jgi:dipeptidyl aminopeptidase/acylaminoacyl peptidase
MKPNHASGLRTCTLLTLSLLLFLPCSHAAQPGRVEFGSFIYDGIAPGNPSADDALPRYLESRSANFMDWLADGSLLITTRFANTAQLHRVSAALGQREQLSFHREPVLGALAHPSLGESLLWFQDHDGDGRQQIWQRNLRDGSERPLTDARTRSGRPVWAQDGKRIAFTSNLRDGPTTDVYTLDTSAGAAPQLVVAGGTGTLLVQDWSMDDTRLLLIHQSSSTESELLIADLATGRTSRVEPDAKTTIPVSVTQAKFSRDGRGVFFLSDHGGEYIELRYLDIYTNESRTIAPQTRWNVQRFTLSADGHYVAYTLNESASDRLVLHDLRQQADVILPALPAGALISAMGFDKRSERLAVNVESATAPADVYVYALATPAPQLARWTQSELGPLDPLKFVAAEAMSFPTWDRTDTGLRNLPAFIYRSRLGGPRPVLLDLRGASDAQARPQWNAFTQYVVNELGYTVIAPNLRGAGGYGRSFLKLDDGEAREDVFRDIGSLLVWIGLQRDLDPARVVAMGAPGGNYLALGSMVQLGDRLVAGIDGVDGSNTRIPPLGKTSPISKPLLLVQGLNDPRVPRDAAALLLALRGGGSDIEWFAARDEGAEFQKKTSRDAWLDAAAQFLRRWK